MIETEIPDTVRRAVGFELVAESFKNLGEDWAANSELYASFAQRIKDEQIASGMPEELWETSRQTLLLEREAASESWLEVDFFSDKNSTNAGGSSDTAEEKSEPDKAIGVSPNSILTSVTPDLNPNLSEFGKLEDTEVDEIEELEDTEVDEIEETEQESLIKKAVPILFEALQQYGEIGEQGTTVELYGKRNKIIWSIPDKKLSVTGEEYLEISFDDNKKVVSYESNLSKNYVEHLEDKVTSKLNQQSNNSVDR